MKLTKRRVIFGAVAACSLLAAGVASAQSALDDIVKSKTIKIAIPTDFPPYGFVGADMTARGLDIDMANLIAAKLGAKPELIPVTTANRIPYLQTKKADLVISTLGKNAEREKVIDFTIAYSPFFIAVFAPKSVAVTTPDGLAGKSIAVTRGSVDDQELSKVAPASTQIRRFEDNNATISAFLAGQTELVATSAQVAATIMQRNSALGLEYKFLLKDSPNFIGVAKGEDSLRTRVNEIIMEARKSGAIDALSKQWLGREAGELPM